uniref:Uncharacterized protein n=1 Tax=Strongyloides venezuelensis TaxID=75913 RepID=A0A0K0FUV8_STRVS
MCSTPLTEKTPVIKEITEVVTTPISLSAYDCTNGTCTPVMCPYNDMYQQTQMGTPISPGLVDVKDSGNNHINIVLNVGSKDKVEEIPSENQHGKVEEITTSSTLNTLSSKLNKNDLKNTNLRQDKNNNEEKKSLDIKKHEAISSFNDPTTVRYTTSGEPLSNVSSKNTSNMKK